MGEVTIVNNTNDKITVSITNTGENGQPGFFEIASKDSSTWKRNKLQVCHVLRADNGNTEVLVVEPGKTYQVEGTGNTNEVTITNNTREKITVSITNHGESGQPGFFEIASKDSSTWKRSNLQVCHVLRADNGNTEVLVVEPGKTYQVEGIGNMNEVTIANNTKEKITVSITNHGESGQPGFFEIASKDSSTWKRSNLQVCHVLRADNGNTKVLVVEPGKTYQVGCESCG